MTRSLLFMALALGIGCSCAQNPKKQVPAPAPQQAQAQPTPPPPIEYIDIVQDAQDADYALIRVQACGGKRTIIRVPMKALETDGDAVSEFVLKTVDEMCALRASE